MKLIALDDVDWKHAAGELLLIIAGVLIALAVNGWSQARGDRRSEIEALGEIRAALRDDMADVRSDLVRHRRAAAAVDAILASLGGPAGCASSNTSRAIATAVRAGGQPA